MRGAHPRRGGAGGRGAAQAARLTGGRVPLRPGVRRRLQQPGTGTGTRTRAGGRPPPPGPDPPRGGPDRVPPRAPGPAAQPARRRGRVRPRGRGPGHPAVWHPVGGHHVPAARPAVHVRSLPGRVRRAGRAPPGPARGRLRARGRLPRRGRRGGRDPAAAGPGPPGPRAGLRCGRPAHPGRDVVSRRPGRRGPRGGAGRGDHQPARLGPGDLRQSRVRVRDPGRLAVPGQRADAAETQPVRAAGTARRRGHPRRAPDRAAGDRAHPVGAHRQLAVRLRRGGRGPGPGRRWSAWDRRW